MASSTTKTPPSKTTNKAAPTTPATAATAPPTSPVPTPSTSNVTARNTPDQLKKGIVWTAPGSQPKTFTFVLVGAMGTGKSTFVELFANILQVKPVFKYNMKALDPSNEGNASKSESRTRHAKVYEFTSKNRVRVRIIDTPGLADPRGVEQDDIHKASTSKEIQQSVSQIDAIFIVSNGTVTRLEETAAYTLSIISTFFPMSWVDNIAFLFTNIHSPLVWNVSEEAVPKALRNASRFPLDNPVALRKRFDELRKTPTKKADIQEMKNAILHSETSALQVLARIFDWVDGLSPRSIQKTSELSLGVEQPSGSRSILPDAVLAAPAGPKSTITASDTTKSALKSPSLPASASKKVTEQTLALRTYAHTSLWPNGIKTSLEVLPRRPNPQHGPSGCGIIFL